MSRLATALLLLSIAGAVVAQGARSGGVRENDARVSEWNRFALGLRALHDALVMRRPVRTRARPGGYGDSFAGPGFFTEVEYLDAPSERVVSRVRWESAHPERVHVIEIYRYDDAGRVRRDYAAAWLPGFRNAPYQTLVNFHDYNEGLHGLRQFDASGERIYEQCAGEYFGEPIRLSFEYHELPGVEEGLTDPESGEIYSACFGFLPARADPYLDPRVEIALLDGATATRRAADSDASPETPSALVERARLRFERLEFEGAIADLDAVIARDPTIDAAWFWRGMALGRAQRFEEAIRDLGVFLERNPESSVGYTKRGIRHFWNGDRERAERDLRRALALDAHNPEAHDDLGVVLAQSGRADEAISHFTTTVRLDPSYQKGFHNLALVEHLRGNDVRALRAVDRGLRLAPDDRASLLLRAQILRALGDEAQALAVERRASRLPALNWSESAELR